MLLVLGFKVQVSRLKRVLDNSVYNYKKKTGTCPVFTYLKTTLIIQQSSSSR